VYERKRDFCIDGLNIRIQQKIKVESLLKWLNPILFPSKHGDRDQNYFDTMHSDWDIDERRIFRNGVLNLHITGIAQGWQSGIIQILKEHTLEVWKQQKKLVRTVLQGSPKNLRFGNRISLVIIQTESSSFLSAISCLVISTT